MKFYESFLFYLAVALLIISPFSGYAIVVFIPLALILLLVDLVLRKLVKNRNTLRTLQFASLALLMSYPFWPRWDHSVNLKVKLPPNFVGNVRIVLGVDGYPPLSSDTATILIPLDGLFLTSTSVGKKDHLDTDLPQQNLPYFEVLGSPNYECEKYKMVSYRVSNVDSITYVPYPLEKNRPQAFYDSLLADPSCNDGLFW
jgi:hypothetical protein